MTGKNLKTKSPIDIRRESKRLARDKAARWLSGHKDDTPLVDAKAERKQRRRELYQQVRTHKRNAAISLAVTQGRCPTRNGSGACGDVGHCGCGARDVAGCSDRVAVYPNSKRKGHGKGTT